MFWVGYILLSLACAALFCFSVGGFEIVGAIKRTLMYLLSVFIGTIMAFAILVFWFHIAIMLGIVLFTFFIIYLINRFPCYEK